LSTIEEAAKPKPNSQIKGENHATKMVFPTINMALGRANINTDFKFDGESKTLYSVATDLWDPVHPATKQKYKDAGKVDSKGNVRVLQTPEQKAEVIKMDDARYPDHTYKYMISYTHLKRMYGSDGNEYLVRYGYLHGVSFMGLPFKVFKMDFDFHNEPEFEQTPVLTGSSFDINYGDIVSQRKVFHTPWNIDEFKKSLKDIPFPNNPQLGIALNIGVEGAPGVFPIQDLKAFQNKSLEDLMNYAQSLDESYLQDEQLPEEVKPQQQEVKRNK